MNDTEFTPGQYERTPLHVEGVQVTATNFLAVAKWCSGTITQINGHAALEDFAGLDPNAQYIKVDVRNPKDGRETRAYVGDFVVKYPIAGFKVLKAKHFSKTFVPTRELAKQLSGTPVIQPPELATATPVVEVDPEGIAEQEQRTWVAPDDTERVDESSVPSNLVTGAPHGEHKASAVALGGPDDDRVDVTARDYLEQPVDHAEETAKKLQAAAQAGGYPTSDEPLPEVDLQTALEATGVKTEISRVCDLQVGADFVYDGVLYGVDSKSDLLLQAKSLGGNTRSFYDNTAIQPEQLPNNAVSWFEQVLTDSVHSDKALVDVDQVAVGLNAPKSVVHEAQPTEVVGGSEDYARQDDLIAPGESPV